MKKEVTPWEVPGEVNYEALVKQFGTEKISSSIAKSLSNTHPILERGLYFSHRELDLWLKDASDGKKVSILTGRGPSERMHIGHLIPFLAARSLQKKYSCPVFIPISDDEKFFVKPHLTIEQVKEYGEQNLLEILALGFEPKKTFTLRDFSYPQLYETASKIAKTISYSQAKAIFGLKPEQNIGWSFYPAVQAFHILWPQFKLGPHKTLVPVGIDQDPFIRLTRDIATHSTISLVKPSAIHSKFLPGLKGSPKMSSSQEETNAIYLTDSPDEVKKKINKYAFSGGKDTIEEHRKHGGNPSIDTSFLYLKYLFEDDEKKIDKIEKDYKAGKLLSGELKAIAIEKINSFLTNHRKQRDKIKLSDFKS